MVRLPEMALVIGHIALDSLSLAHDYLVQMLTFDDHSGEIDELLLYRTYFDFESLEEFGQRISQVGLQ